MVKEILTSILSAGMGMLLTYIFTELRARQKRQDAIQTGLQALLRDRIIQVYNHYVTEKKWIPIYAKDSIVSCYESYENLGANGVIDDLMAEIKALPNYKGE